MKFDRKIHITTEQIADLMGVSATELTGGMVKYGGPRALFRARVNGRQQSVYDRMDAVSWVDEQSNSERFKKKPQSSVVPPRETKPLAEQGIYRPSLQMRLNYERAEQLYGHRLITPVGTGNDREFAHGHMKVRLQ